MQDFPANSQKAKAKMEPREKIEAVTSAETVKRKRGLGRKFKDTFIGGDAKTALDHAVFTVVIPEAKDVIYSFFDSVIRGYFFGEDPHKAHRRNMTTGYPDLGRVNYSSMSRQAKAPEQRMLSRRSRARHDFDEVIIPTHQEANEVIDRLYDLLSRYGSASVADLYELTGIQSSHTDMKWGWVELRGAKAIRLRQGGFLLDLPEPEPLD